MVKRYLVDSQHSRFTVHAFAAGLLAGFGHSPRFAIREFEGKMRFCPDGSDESTFAMKVRAASLALIDPMKEAERQEIETTLKNDVLNVEKYPAIAFGSTAIALTKIADDWFRAQIQGEMRLHGVTRPLSIDSQLRLEEGDIRLSGEFSLAFPEYGIKPVTGMGGLIKVKDNLKFTFDLVGHEQEGG